jgi:23S rRNA pseudouridine2457 synthase
MIILFNKPYNVLCQFTDNEGRKTLADYITIKNVYAAGRLDSDSEGLVILTDDGRVQNLISNPVHKLEKTYWVQVEGIPDEEAIIKLRTGVLLKDGMTKPAKVKIIDEPRVEERTPPIRKRKNIPTSWIELIITEGRNRQVRRMTASVGYPTLRLIRFAIGEWSITGINPGAFKQILINPI